MGWEWYISLTCPELVAGMGGNGNVRWQLGRVKGWGWGFRHRQLDVNW